MRGISDELERLGLFQNSLSESADCTIGDGDILGVRVIAHQHQRRRSTGLDERVNELDTRRTILRQNAVHEH
jgi:hypothetical protein